MLFPVEPTWFWAVPANTPSCPLGQISHGATQRHPPPNRRPTTWRVLGSFAVVFIETGRGRYEDANGVLCDLRAGDAVLVKPQLEHRYFPTDQGWTETYLVFDGPVFDFWDQNGWLDLGPVVRPAADRDWAETLRQVAGHHATDCEDGFNPWSSVCRMQSLLAQLFGQGDAGPSTRKPTGPAWIEAAKTKLAAGLDQLLDLQKLADELNVSYSTFRRSFTRAVGVSPGRYRAGLVIDEARQMMQHTALSDKQISVQLGFTDAQHFSRRFKQIVGRTPTAFRRSLR